MARSSVSALQKSLFVPRLLSFKALAGSEMCSLPEPLSQLAGTPPPKGFIKMNTNGSAINNPRQVGAEGYLETILGVGCWVMPGTSGIPMGIPMASLRSYKIYAIHEGLSLAVTC
ncbi:hypothetical protein SLE2022_146740 [Rubroshorea leprosula]